MARNANMIRIIIAMVVMGILLVPSMAMSEDARQQQEIEPPLSPSLVGDAPVHEPPPMVNENTRGFTSKVSTHAYPDEDHHQASDAASETTCDEGVSSEEDTRPNPNTNPNTNSSNTSRGRKRIRVLGTEGADTKQGRKKRRKPSRKKRRKEKRRQKKLQKKQRKRRGATPRVIESDSDLDSEGACAEDQCVVGPSTPVATSVALVLSSRQQAPDPTSNQRKTSKAKGSRSRMVTERGHGSEIGIEKAYNTPSGPAPPPPSCSSTTSNLQRFQTNTAPPAHRSPSVAPSVTEVMVSARTCLWNHPVHEKHQYYTALREAAVKFPGKFSYSATKSAASQLPAQNSTEFSVGHVGHDVQIKTTVEVGYSYLVITQDGLEYTVDATPTARLSDVFDVLSMKGGMDKNRVELVLDTGVYHHWWSKDILLVNLPLCSNEHNTAAADADATHGTSAYDGVLGQVINGDHDVYAQLVGVEKARHCRDLTCARVRDFATPRQACKYQPTRRIINGKECFEQLSNSIYNTLKVFLTHLANRDPFSLDGCECKAPNQRSGCITNAGFCVNAACTHLRATYEEGDQALFLHWVCHGLFKMSDLGTVLACSAHDHAPERGVCVREVDTFVRTHAQYLIQHTIVLGFLKDLFRNLLNQGVVTPALILMYFTQLEKIVKHLHSKRDSGLSNEVKVVKGGKWDLAAALVFSKPNAPLGTKWWLLRSTTFLTNMIRVFGSATMLAVLDHTNIKWFDTTLSTSSSSSSSNATTHTHHGASVEERQSRAREVAMQLVRGAVDTIPDEEDTTKRIIERAFEVLYTQESCVIETIAFYPSIVSHRCIQESLSNTQNHAFTRKVLDVAARASRGLAASWECLAKHYDVEVLLKVAEEHPNSRAEILRNLTVMQLQIAEVVAVAADSSEESSPILAQLDAQRRSGCVDMLTGINPVHLTRRYILHHLKRGDRSHVDTSCLIQRNIATTEEQAEQTELHAWYIRNKSITAIRNLGPEHMTGAFWLATKKGWDVASSYDIDELTKSMIIRTTFLSDVRVLECICEHPWLCRSHRFQRHVEYVLLKPASETTGPSPGCKDTLYRYARRTCAMAIHAMKDIYEELRREQADHVFENRRLQNHRTILGDTIMGKLSKMKQKSLEQLKAQVNSVQSGL
jgi:hypothetical protein